MRGTVVAVVLALPLLFFVVNAVVALAEQFLAGFIPSQWFSGNVFDWMTAFGNKGGAASYLAFMVNAILAYACYASIVRAFNGKPPDSSSR